MEATKVYVGSELTEAQKPAIDAIINDQAPKEIISFVNADFTDDEDTPGGLVVVHDGQAKVHVDSIPQNAFQYIVVSQVLPKPGGGEWTDTDFTGPEKERLLNDAVPQFSQRPPALSKYGQSNKDDQVWDAELGSRDSFCGIFKKVHGGKARDGNSTYYVVAQAGSPVASQQLRDKIQRSPNMTFRDLLRDPDFNHAHYIAQRNAARIAYNVARALKVPIRHQQDIGSHLEHNYAAYPWSAIPNFEQSCSEIVEMCNSSADVGVFHAVRPSKQAMNQCLVWAGPYEGLAMFNMRGKSRSIGLPATTGRSQMPPDPDTPVDYRKRSHGIVWEQKKGYEHPDLHPEAFKAVDDEFLDSMKRLGWADGGMDNRHYIIPVLSKIFNPEIERFE